MMKNKIREIIRKTINEMIEEGRYDFSSTPYNSKSERNYSLNRNPLTIDNGGHNSNDVLSQVSTYDSNGANFDTNENIVLSDNQITIYKIKNFNNTDINSTIDFFGKGSVGEKNLRKAIDTINGAAVRNNRDVMYRTITSASNKHKNKFIGTFWEFSLDNGNSWYILKPNPVNNMQLSKLKKNK